MPVLSLQNGTHFRHFSRVLGAIHPLPDLIAMLPLACRLLPVLDIDLRHSVNILIFEQSNRRKKFTTGPRVGLF